MKTYRLSTIGECITGILFSIAAIAGMVLLLIALRADIGLLIATAIGCLLLCAGLVYYVLCVIKAACVVEPENKRLIVKHFPSDYEIDLSNAVLLQTRARKVGHTASRVLIFTDADKHVIASIPTFFTINQGVQAEPMAIELAKALNIPFKANLEPWEYDKEAKIEHDKQMAEKERQETKARNRAKILYLRKKLLSRAGVDNVKPTAHNEKVSSAGKVVPAAEASNCDAENEVK